MTVQIDVTSQKFLPPLLRADEWWCVYLRRRRPTLDSDCVQNDYGKTEYVCEESCRLAGIDGIYYI